MVTEGTHESQIGLITEQHSSQTKGQLCLLGPRKTFNSLGSPSSLDDAVIIGGDKILGSWCDNNGGYNELSCVYMGTPKPKGEPDVVSRFDSCLSSTIKPLSSTNEITIIEDNEEEKTLESKKKKPRLESPKGKNNDAAPPTVDSCLSSPDLHDKKKTKNDERSVDVCADESVAETTSTSFNKGYTHVTLEDLGVSVEDLKSIPWEAFDPTWEIRSVAMDPWLGGYVEDMFPSC